MQILRNTALASLAALLFLLVGTNSAQATNFGNPSPDIKDGESVLGVGLSDVQIAAMYDLGIGDGVLGVMAGTFEPGTATGSEFGVSYKHKLGETFKIGRFPVNMGVIGSFRSAKVEETFFGSKFEYTLNRLDLGVGGTISPAKRLNTFAAVFYERASYKVNVFGFEQDVTDSGIAFMGGAEFWISPTFVAGAEIHSGFYDDDLALYAGFKF